MDFTVLVDADSLLARQRAIILKMARKSGIKTMFFADRELSDVLRDQKLFSNIQMIVVSVGSDSADDEIVKESKKDDLAITHDILLADRLIEKDVLVIDDRGNTYSNENIKERLSLRNMMMDLREVGVFNQKTKAFREKDIKAFADCLNKVISKRRNS